MKRFIFVCALLLSLAAGAQTRQQNLTDHVCFLASDELKGRKAGSAEAGMAADYISKQYNDIGIKTYLEYFMKYGKEYSNVIGLIEGSDPVLKNEYIVLGAHYDHLGIKEGQIYNGADDNASGSAALIEVARDLYANRENLKRSIIIAAFDAEELGLYGSQTLSDILADSLGKEKIKLMMSLDMVGWYKASGTLSLEGVGTIKNGKDLVTSEAAGYPINVKPVKFEKSIFTATDTYGFAQKGIPTLAVTTGLKSPYHKPEDDADLIDYEGLDNISRYVSALTERIASDPSFEGSGKIARKHSDKVARVEFGLSAGYQTSSINFRKSSLQTKSAGGYNAGAQLLFNFGMISLHTRALYESTKSMFPSSEDLFTSTARFKQKSLTVPVLVNFNSGRGRNNSYIGVGGYYSKVLDSNIGELSLPGYGHLSGKEDIGGPSIDDNQFGFALSLGARVSNIQLSIDWRSRLGGFFKEEALPKARLNTVSFGLGYLF